MADGDEVVIQDEHVEDLDLDDEPDLVVIQVYITSAYRAYALADHYRRRGVHVCLGGLHVTSLPEEAAPHADTLFLGPGEETWPLFLADFRAGRPLAIYRSVGERTLAGAPRPRRDLIRRHLYLVPNSIVVSRGCPHSCDFCYKEAFFEGGPGFYTMAADAALAEIADLPGRHLYFLDDHLFGNRRFATALHARMQAEGRVTSTDWDRYDTRHAVYRPARMSAEGLEAGYRKAYREFYRWSAIARGAATKGSAIGFLRHFGYAAAWKKFEPVWDGVIRAKRVMRARPALEWVLDLAGRHNRSAAPRADSAFMPMDVGAGAGTKDRVPG